MLHGLPQDYVARSDNAHYLDVPTDLVYQPHVYEFASFLARRCGATRIMDIGCGSGGKLIQLAKDFEVIGIDCPATIPLFRKTLPVASWVECDLDLAMPEIPAELLADSVVICADVIEHLREPALLGQYLAKISEIAPFVLISTPDRDRVRGWLDCGPPANPNHVREWNASEFSRFLRSVGFSDRTIHGHTINTDHHRANTTLLVVAGAQALPKVASETKKVAAIIHCYNEEDILPEVVNHLVGQGIEVCVFDNWSTDGSWEVACALEKRGLLAFLGRFPEYPSDDFEWARQLEHTTVFAQCTDADWVIHYDADELRYSPWPGVTLAEAISWIDSLGYNAIDFTVIDFRFLSGRDAAEGPFEQALTHFEFGRRDGHFAQVKAWQNRPDVQLAESGGHDAEFAGRRVYPLKFLTKHYPLRSDSQAQRKIFRDRLPRIGREHAERGWHGHYNQFVQDGGVPGWRPHELIPWAEQLFLTEHLVQRLSGIGLRD